MKQSGIYFLFGRDDDNHQDTVYIGQATTRKNGEGVMLRIQEHTRDSHSGYFNDVIVLTTQNDSFGPTEISYLENRFTQLAKKANRVVVRNGNEPNPGNVSEKNNQSWMKSLIIQRLSLVLLGIVYLFQELIIIYRLMRNE